VGPLAGHPGVFTLNGLGTRGVLIGPAMARQLVEYLIDGETLSKEVQPSRAL
jgi:glycine/D-amino acid oxidase-like deaminating enzyme